MKRGKKTPAARGAGPEESLIRALLDIRIVAERAGWDRSANDVAGYAMNRAIEALEAAGYDPHAGYPLIRVRASVPLRAAPTRASRTRGEGRR